MTPSPAYATPNAGIAHVVSTAGTAVVAASGPWVGGKIKNPTSATGTLYYNLVSSAGTVEGGSTFALSAGQEDQLPAVQPGVVLSVNASC